MPRASYTPGSGFTLHDLSTGREIGRAATAEEATRIAAERADLTLEDDAAAIANITAAYQRAENAGGQGDVTRKESEAKTTSDPNYPPEQESPITEANEPERPPVPLSLENDDSLDVDPSDRIPARKVSVCNSCDGKRRNHTSGAYPGEGKPPPAKIRICNPNENQ